MPLPRLRIARPTNALERIAKMYCEGLEMVILSQFNDHDGVDGITLGHPNEAYHLEFTQKRGHKAPHAPSDDHLLVFYLPDGSEWERRCGQMRAASFAEVPSFNPFWDRHGATFEDPEGYRIVLVHGSPSS